MTDRQLAARGLKQLSDEIKAQQQRELDMKQNLAKIVNMESAVRMVNQKVRTAPLSTKTNVVVYCKWMHPIFVIVSDEYDVNINTLKSNWGRFIENGNNMPLSNKRGRRESLTRLEEGALKQWIVEMSAENKGPEPHQVQNEARNIVKRRGGGHIDGQEFSASDTWLKNLAYLTIANSDSP